MNLSRWKLLAGVFGLSVCGLAALAEPACRTAGHGAGRQLPPVAESKPEAKPKQGGSTLPPPIEVSPPKPADVKPTPAPAPLPSLSPALPTPLLGEPVELTLPTAKDDKVKGDALPAFPLPGLPSPTPNIPGATAVPDAGPVALPGPTPVDVKPLPVPSDPKPVEGTPTKEFRPGSGALPSVGGLPPLPMPHYTPPVPQPPMPTGSLPLPQPMDPKPQQLLPPTALTPTPPAPEVRAVEARSATPSVEKRLKVTLQMGEGNPRFEIRDGDEVVLKVVSDKIDVKAPTEKGDLWSTLKASGRVKFHSPGGDGYCDELVIVPGSCEVIATGKVQFKYNWGKVETAVTSERMTFRLGATPGSQ